MDTYISDKDQIDMIKKWWKENGRFTLITVAITFIATSGWHYWQNKKNQESAAASITFEQMLTHEANHQLSHVEFDATNLQTNYSKTPYASFAAFISAQNAVNSKNYAAALEKLDWILANTKNADFKQVAKLRQARILLEMKNIDKALTVLSIIDSKTYLPLVYEVKGDIYMAKGDKLVAHRFYQDAMRLLPQDSPNHNFLQMKLDQTRS